MLNIRLFAIASFVVLFAARATAVQCVPTHYVDGDTFHFVQAGDVVKVRIAGFDAPERAQEYGKQARQFLEDLTKGGADCDCYKRDRYGRSVCRVTVAGRNVATAMLAAGYGCIDARFVAEEAPATQAGHQAALTSAQTARRGMWGAAAPLCGKEFRDLKNAH
jgi:endonuclease YncB( thermonuclease family)